MTCVSHVVPAVVSVQVPVADLVIVPGYHGDDYDDDEDDDDDDNDDDDADDDADDDDDNDDDDNDVTWPG